MMKMSNDDVVFTLKGKDIFDRDEESELEESPSTVRLRCWQCNGSGVEPSFFVGKPMKCQQCRGRGYIVVQAPHFTY
jgi:hypothetical protein